MRIKFRKGMQRRFIEKVLEKLRVPSLRSLSQFGLDVKYSTLKNYFSEKRLLPEDFFKDLIKLSKLNEKEFDFEIIKNNWGQVKGGKRTL